MIVTVETDIRDQIYPVHDDIKALNFIIDRTKHHFRAYYRQGLRSHVIEVLSRDDVEKEKKGTIVNGVRWFPRAKPIKILRIFKSSFKNWKDAFNEALKFQMIAGYLSFRHIARSTEFLVDYKKTGQRSIILCGLQEFIDGEILDPWSFLGENDLKELLPGMKNRRENKLNLPNFKETQTILQNIESLIERTKKMIKTANCIPDLSGYGNLILTPDGDVKLVDINNISPLAYSDEIFIDDKGYPVCDKSIEVMALFEEKLLHMNSIRKDPFFSTYFSPGRINQVKDIEKQFYQQYRLT